MRTQVITLLIALLLTAAAEAAPTNVTVARVSATTAGGRPISSSSQLAVTWRATAGAIAPIAVAAVLLNP